MSIPSNVPQDEAPDHLESQRRVLQQQQQQDTPANNDSNEARSSLESTLIAPGVVATSPTTTTEIVVPVGPSTTTATIAPTRTADDAVVIEMSSIYEQRMTEKHPPLSSSPHHQLQQNVPSQSSDSKNGMENEEEEDEVPFVIKDLGDFGTATSSTAPGTSTTTNKVEILRDFSSSRPYMNDKMQGIMKARGLLDHNKSNNDPRTTNSAPEGSWLSPSSVSTSSLSPSGGGPVNPKETSSPREQPQEEVSFFKHAKKATVGVVGGAMTAVGLVMIPLPTPFGVVVAGSGLAVLGTEFPAAKQVLETSRDKLVEVIETHVVTEDDDDEDGNGSSVGRHNQQTATTTSPSSIRSSTTEKLENKEKDTGKSKAEASLTTQDKQLQRTSSQDDQNLSENIRDGAEDNDQAGTNKAQDATNEAPAWLSQGPSSEEEIRAYSNRHPEVPPELQTSLEETWKKYRKQASRVGRKVIPVLKMIGVSDNSSGGNRSGISSASSSFDEYGSRNDGGVVRGNGTATSSSNGQLESPLSPQSRQVFI